MADGEPGTGGPMGKDAIAAGVAKWSDSDLMSQLRKTFGFEGTANELVRIDVSSLHVFLAQRPPAGYSGKVGELPKFHGVGV